MCLLGQKKLKQKPMKYQNYIHLYDFQSSTVVYKHACSLVSSEMAEAFLNALSERIKPL